MSITYRRATATPDPVGSVGVKYQFSGGAAGCTDELGTRSHGSWRRIAVIMVAAGHMACGPVTAMRWWSGALSNRRRHEDASRHHSVGRGCRDGHVRRRFGAPGYGHAVQARVSGWRPGA